MFIFKVRSLIYTLTLGPIALIVSCAIAGLGRAGITIGVFTIIRFSLSAINRLILLGFIGATYGIAAVLRSLIRGVFINGVT